MEIKAQVRSIENLMEYFFHVPDYQREYVWQAHDQVEQFLIDIEPDLTEKVQEMSSYFLGAIIIILLVWLGCVCARRCAERRAEWESLDP